MSNHRDMSRITEEVKSLAKQYGAVLVGVGSIDRFDPLPPFLDAAPQGHHPRDFLPDAQSVISIAQPILDPVMDAPARLATQDSAMIPPDVRYHYGDVFYNQVGHVVQDYMLEFIGQLLGQYLMSQGYQAMIFPTTGLHPRVDGLTDEEIWEGPSGNWARKYAPLRYTYGPFSHRHAATRAGLGEFGYNNIVLTREFGPRQRFNSIITNADLVADPLITEPICLRDECLLCLKACVVDAITLRDDPNVIDYRSVSSMDRDSIFIDTPAKTDPTICRRRRKRIPDSPVRGDCARVCPLPKERKDLPDRLVQMLEDWKRARVQT